MPTVLYLGPRCADGLGLHHLDAAKRMPDGAVVMGDRRWLFFDDRHRALGAMEAESIDLVLVDTRASDGSAPTRLAEADAGDFLAELFHADRSVRLVQPNRVLGLVAGDAEGVSTAYRLGHHRIGDILVDPELDVLVQTVDARLNARGTGRIAVCLAGGGIEGLLYEIGVLRALDAFLADRSVVDFDLFCGISAGSILGAFLANGIGPDEIARGLSGGSARIEPMRRSDIFDPNLGEISERLSGLLREAMRGGVGPRGIVSSLARAVPGGIFAGDRLRAYMQRQLSAPGMSDRFDSLRRPLFIGATDQDTSEAVVFGEQGNRDVPVHRAVRASSALVPFYAPEQIDGRYYSDGGFSRTTNMRVAVRQGATLVILIDPLVPVRSDVPGYVHARGGIFASMQGVKAIINGRFDKAARALAEMFPDVNFVLFRPEAEEMKILSGSPMKYFYRRQVEQIAFQNTIEKIRASLPQLRRDFALHGVTVRDPFADEDSPGRARRFEPDTLGVGL